MLRHLNKVHGLPEGQIKGSESLFPTIPTSHIQSCTKPVGYFGSLPIDKQANYVALCYIMVKGQQQQFNRSFAITVNEGDVHYGDTGFRGLNSFRTT